jgi:4-hydroxy-tetrahydrodipicolinate synthase
MADNGLLSGVHSVLATPFLLDESVDEQSLISLIAAFRKAMVSGVLILGVMGEADRLSDAERDFVVETTISARDRLQVTVGVTHQSTVVTRARARKAADMGASAVMVAPPAGSMAGPALREHFQRIADGLDIPVVVQDHPVSSGVKLPVEFLASLEGALPSGSAIKLEDPPAPSKIAALRRQTSAFSIFGGLGGLTLFEEMRAGADGTMTGFCIPDFLVQIVMSCREGQFNTAQSLHDFALPLMLFETQPGAGASLRKEILRRRGFIAHATVRHPAAEPDPVMLAPLDGLLERTLSNFCLPYTGYSEPTRDVQLRTFEA